MGASGRLLAQLLLDLLFFVLEVEKDVLGEADGVLFRQVDPAVGDDRPELADGGVRHPDHHLGFLQNFLTLGFGETFGPLGLLPVLPEVLDEIPDAQRTAFLSSRGL